MARQFGGQVEFSGRSEYGAGTLEVTNGSRIIRWPRRRRSTSGIATGTKSLPVPWVFAPRRARKIREFAAIEHLEKSSTDCSFTRKSPTRRAEKRFCRISSSTSATARWIGRWARLSTKPARGCARQVGDQKVVLGLSGGVDSSVVAALLHKAIGDQLTCIFVNNGLLRAREDEIVQRVFVENFHVRLKYVDASERFLQLLEGVTDPEQKRKIIGNEFIKVFEQATQELLDEERANGADAHSGYHFLAQGTLYPDVIESVAIGDNPASLIKSHHNVGGLPEKMHFELVEPVRQLFKDEVRQAGLQLGLPKEVVYRQPFPGPGLAVRILGEVTPEALRILRDADTIVTSEMEAAEWYYRVWQSFAVLLPVRERRRDGRPADLRKHDRAAHRGKSGRHDRGLGAGALRLARADLDPHLQRSQRRESRRLRHLEQAAEHDRVGVSVPARTNQRGKPWKGLLASLIFSGCWPVSVREASPRHRLGSRTFSRAISFPCDLQSTAFPGEMLAHCRQSVLDALGDHAFRFVSLGSARCVVALDRSLHRIAPDWRSVFARPA